jgi:hypothetical protein
MSHATAHPHSLAHPKYSVVVVAKVVVHDPPVQLHAQASLSTV